MELWNEDNLPPFWNINRKVSWTHKWINYIRSCKYKCPFSFSHVILYFLESVGSGSNSFSGYYDAISLLSFIMNIPIASCDLSSNYCKFLNWKCAGALSCSNQKRFLTKMENILHQRHVGFPQPTHYYWIRFGWRFWKRLLRRIIKCH